MLQTERELNRAVVTGPTGVIGRALCRQLLEQGVTVYAVVRPGSARADTLPAGVRTVACDLSELARLPALIPAADALFHLAWGGTLGPARNDRALQERNVACAVAAVEAAARLGCRTFVGAGSQAEYGRVEGLLRPDTPACPENEYGRAKLLACAATRQRAEQLGLVQVWPRVLSIYGPGDNPGALIPQLIAALLNGQEPALTKGEQLWDYLYADDAARALLCMARRGRPGGIYPVGSGAAYPLRRYVEQVRDAIDPALPLGFGKVPYGPKQVMHLQADLTALRGDTGFDPQIPFAQGIQTTIAWYKERLA